MKNENSFRISIYGGFDMRVFIVSPHPDDAEFGCGGLSMKCLKVQHEVTYLLNTKSNNDEDLFYTDGRRNEGHTVKKKGIRVIEFACNGTTVALEDIIFQDKPDVILNVWSKDFNETHRLVSNFVDLAVERVRLRQKRYDLPVLGYYETFSSIQFMPNIIFDVTEEYIEALNLLKLHKQGIEKLPVLPYSFQIRHQSRGLDGGVLYGEAICFNSMNQYLWVNNVQMKQSFIDSII